MKEPTKEEIDAAADKFSYEFAGSLPEEYLEYEEGFRKGIEWYKKQIGR